jgi:hypothetical protein
MAVLETWGKFSTYTDSQGFYRVIWQDVPTGQIVMHKFTAQPSLTYMERFFDKQLFGSLGVVHEIEFDEADEADFKMICAYIRSNPTTTLTQWNNYLNSLGAWQKGVVFKAYMYKLARKLHERGAITLANYTEGTVWTATRNWIVNTNLNTVKRVIFGYLIQL